MKIFNLNYFYFLVFIIHFLGFCYFMTIPQVTADSNTYFSQAKKLNVDNLFSAKTHNNVSRIQFIVSLGFKNLNYGFSNFIFSSLSLFGIFLIIKATEDKYKDILRDKKLVLLLLLFLLPNIHVWTGCISKEALLCFIFGVIFHLFSKNKLILGIFISLLIYYVRPHFFIFFCSAILLSFIIQYIVERKNISYLFMVLALLIFSSYVYLKNYLWIQNISFESVISYFNSKILDQGSTVLNNFADKNPFEKLASLFYLPIVDKISIVNFILSLEILIFIFIILSFLRPSFMRWLIKADLSISSFFLFAIITLFFISQHSNNFGHLMRQKSIPIFILYLVFINFTADMYLQKNKSIAING
jgi:hypothetical protein